LGIRGNGPAGLRPGGAVAVRPRSRRRRRRDRADRADPVARTAARPAGSARTSRPRGTGSPHHRSPREQEVHVSTTDEVLPDQKKGGATKPQTKPKETPPKTPKAPVPEHAPVLRTGRVRTGPAAIGVGAIAAANASGQNAEIGRASRKGR